MRQLTNRAKTLNIRNKSGRYYSDGAFKNMIGKSIERKDGMFETDIQAGRLVARRIKDGGDEIAQELNNERKNNISKSNNKKAWIEKKKKKMTVPKVKIPKKLGFYPQPGKLSQSIYAQKNTPNRVV